MQRPQPSAPPRRAAVSVDAARKQMAQLSRRVGPTNQRQSMMAQLRQQQQQMNAQRRPVAVSPATVSPATTLPSASTSAGCTLEGAKQRSALRARRAAEQLAAEVAEEPGSESQEQLESIVQRQAEEAATREAVRLQRQAAAREAAARDAAATAAREQQAREEARQKAAQAREVAAAARARQSAPPFAPIFKPARKKRQLEDEPEDRSEPRQAKRPKASRRGKEKRGSAGRHNAGSAAGATRDDAPTPHASVDAHARETETELAAAGWRCMQSINRADLDATEGGTHAPSEAAEGADGGADGDLDGLDGEAPEHADQGDTTAEDDDATEEEEEDDDATEDEDATCAATTQDATERGYGIDEGRTQHPMARPWWAGSTEADGSMEIATELGVGAADRLPETPGVGVTQQPTASHSAEQHSPWQCAVCTHVNQREDAAGDVCALCGVAAPGTPDGDARTTTNEQNEQNEQSTVGDSDKTAMDSDETEMDEEEAVAEGAVVEEGAEEPQQEMPPEEEPLEAACETARDAAGAAGDADAAGAADDAELAVGEEEAEVATASPPSAPVAMPAADPTAHARAWLQLADGVTGCDADCDKDHLHTPRVVNLHGAPGETRLVLGRGVGCDVQLDSQLYPQMVSREHCALICDDDSHWWVEELRSQNGTAVNSQKLRKKQPRQRLRVGDELHIGCTHGPCISEIVYVFGE